MFNLKDLKMKLLRCHSQGFLVLSLSFFNAKETIKLLLIWAIELIKRKIKPKTFFNTFPTTRIWVYPTKEDSKWRSKSWSFCWWCFFVSEIHWYTCWFQQVSSFQDLDHMRIWMKKSHIEAWKHGNQFQFGGFQPNRVGIVEIETYHGLLPARIPVAKNQGCFSVGISGPPQKSDVILVVETCNPGWSKGGIPRCTTS